MHPTIRDLLRKKRGELGREAVAAKAREAAPTIQGIHRTAIERWENGLGAPSPGQFEAWCQALGLTDEERLTALRLAAGQDGDVPTVAA